MIEINNTTKFKINEKLIKGVTEKFLLSHHLQKKYVSLAFVGEARMRELNKRYRKKDKTTDILSFQNSPSQIPLLVKEGLGEVKKTNPAYPPLRKRRDKISSPLEGGAREISDLGEIIINPAQIKRQAKENNNSFQQELIFVLVHGLLHLAGYDDKTEKDRLAMIGLGEKFIKKLEVKSKK